jgi:hypothetical protein
MGSVLALSGTIVTVEVPLALASAWDTAVMVKVVVTELPRLSDFVGTALGATKSPVLEIKPSFRLPPAVLFTSHVTAVLEVPVTVAVNC